MKSSNYIAESVYKVNLDYARLQNQTEELFFRCLDEGRDVEYFNQELDKIWGNINHSYMGESIEEYSEIIHERNISGKQEVEVEKKGNQLFALVPFSVIIGIERKFQKLKEREYEKSITYIEKLSGPTKELQKDEYLKLKVSRYNNQIVPYYSKATGEIIRYVQPSTYNSMIHNTNLTRSGWNQTLEDADRTGQTMFWIPYHPFSCPHCLEHQNRPLTKREIIDIAGTADEVSGDILHPNCKCEITFYMNDTKFNKPNYSDGELEEQYHIRQKVNSLTLRKEEVATDIRIQKRLGNQDVVDELNNMRNKLNKEIKNLQNKLPTEELKKQVIAINRIKIQSSNKYIEQAKRNIQSKANKKIIESKLKTDVKNKVLLKELNKSSMQTHKEMQELFKIRENRPKYVEQLERKQQELKNTRKIIKQKNNDMKYWKAKQQELSLKVDIKNLKELINK